MTASDFLLRHPGYFLDKDLVFAHYGRRCRCCGSYKYSSIDHVEGGGKEHRKQLGWNQTLYRWLIEQGYPDGFQTLCRSCNSSKRDGAFCRIHYQEEKKSA